MSEQNKALFRRTIEEVFNQRKLEVIDELYAANFVLHDPSQSTKRMTATPWSLWPHRPTSPRRPTSFGTIRDRPGSWGCATPRKHDDVPAR